jgi:diguanylate cyclase (GGDEF)-like protein
VQVVALVPRTALEGALTDLNLRLLLAALGSIAIVAAVAFLSGRTIVASLRELARGAMAIAHGHLSERVPVRGRDELARVGVAFNEMAEQLEMRQRELLSERQRVRRATEQLGAALSAGNEPERLLEVIAASALEMTEAVGVTIVHAGDVLASAGSPEIGGDPVTLDIGPAEEGPHRLLLLYPIAGRRFDEATIEEAISLAAQATVALENARLHQILARQAVTDELTQLANRRRFEEELAHEVNRVLRFGGPLSLLVADLDDFKQINDGYGHPVGDAALRAFADALRSGIRAVDIAARPGGEEFAVILPGTALREARAVAERLRRTFAATQIPVADAESITLTASFGVAEYVPGAAPDDLFGAADTALYEAKALGKNRVAMCEEYSAARQT